MISLFLLACPSRLVKNKIDYLVLLTALSNFFTDINECDKDPSVCHENADCTNEPGTYSCECKDGFVGDGVDECDGTIFSLFCLLIYVIVKHRWVEISHKIMPFEAIAEYALFLRNFNTQRCLTLLKLLRQLSVHRSQK